MLYRLLVGSLNTGCVIEYCMVFGCVIEYYMVLENATDCCVLSRYVIDYCKVIGVSLSFVLLLDVSLNSYGYCVCR